VAYFSMVLHCRSEPGMKRGSKQFFGSIMLQTAKSLETLGSTRLGFISYMYLVAT